MKKYLVLLLILAAVLVNTTNSAQAQIYVTVRPTAPVIVRPVIPSPRHVWIDGEWMWRGGKYEYVNGYWAVPRFRGALWIPGHWKNTRRGWVWKPGHWRR